MPKYCNFITFIFNNIENAELVSNAKRSDQFLLSFVNAFSLFLSKMPSWCQMLNWLKQFLLSFVKYHTSFGDNLRNKLTEKIPRKMKKSSSMQINAKNIVISPLSFLTILHMPSWCQMLNGLINSCSVSLMLFHYFYQKCRAGVKC